MLFVGEFVRHLENAVTNPDKPADTANDVETGQAPAASRLFDLVFCAVQNCTGNAGIFRRKIEYPCRIVLTSFDAAVMTSLYNLVNDNTLQLLLLESEVHQL